MTYLFSKANTEALARFLASRVLLAFDFDGTLAPIVVDRTSARMRRRTLRLLKDVCRLYPCAVISGRRRDDVLARLEGLPVRHVVGNHGVECAPAASNLATTIATVLAHLEISLAGVGGAEIEGKTYSIAVHYRRATDRTSVRALIEQALSDIPSGCRVVSGKRVFDVVPSGAPHKGDALAYLRATDALDAAIYVGDDATDEDVFRQADPATLLPIRIGRSRHSAASYFVRDQRELDLLLEHFARARG